MRTLLEAGTDSAAWAAAVSSIAAPDPAQIACPDWNTAAFFKAAKASDVTRCLEAGAGLEVGDRSGKTPLRLAAEAGNVEALTTLAKAGADPNTLSASAETPLLAMASSGTAETVKALLQAGADPNAPTARGITPLDLFAALNKDAETVKVLLEAGADLNARDRQDGSTPLHTAARVGTAEVMAVLLEAGADPNALDRNRKTPWDIARDREALKGSDVYSRLASATSAHPQLDCGGWNTKAFFEAAEASEVARCLEAGADLNARSKLGRWTPLHMAALYSQPAVIETLLEAGADPNVQSADGRVPLHMAVGYAKYTKSDHNRNAEVTTTLLEAGADPSARSSGRRTLLHIAAGGGQLLVTRALLLAGADPQARTEDGLTPLHFAANSIHPNTPEVVTELLNSRADPRARNEEGKSAWDLVQHNNTLKKTGAYRRLEAGAEGTSPIRPPTAQPRVQLGGAPEPTPTHAHVDCANWNTGAFFAAASESDVTRCLTAGADPNVRDRGGFTPLHLAAFVGNAGAVAALVNRGADVEGRSTDGLTPLHRAVALRNSKAVIALLEAGADPNGRDEAGQTPLHFADTVEVVAALLEAGANPNLRAVNGTTPLDYVDNKAVRALLEAAGVVPAPALGACANWNTASFFEAAKLSDVTRCLQLGADLETRDGRGETPLYKALKNGTAEAATAMLQAGANPDARNVICMTPLHYAAALWRSGAGMALLAAGADPALRDEDGDFPFDEIPSGIGDILRLQAKGLFPPGGQIGGRLQTDFYSKLYQGKFSQVHRRLSPNPIPPECSESGDLRSIPSAPRRNRPRVR